MSKLTIKEMKEQAEWMKEKKMAPIEYYVFQINGKMLLIPYPNINKIFETPILEAKVYEE
jgi:hypothetical protein